jgi:hypothetical protein
MGGTLNQKAPPIYKKTETRPSKPANNKIEQEIHKDLEDLWNRREYKGGQS